MKVAASISSLPDREDEFHACVRAFGRSFLVPSEPTPLVREAIRARAGEAAALARQIANDQGRMRALAAALAERSEQAHHLAAGRYGSGHHGTFASCGAESCRSIRELLWQQ